MVKISTRRLHMGLQLAPAALLALKIFSVVTFSTILIVIPETKATPLPVPEPAPSALLKNSYSTKCEGISCTPNPGNCRANYGGGDGCCPVWQCTGRNGGIFTSYGMTRTSGGYGRSSQSSSSSSSSSSNNNGGIIHSRIGGSVTSSSNSNNFGFQPFPNPPNVFAYARSGFPGFADFNNYDDYYDY